MMRSLKSNLLRAGVAALTLSALGACGQVGGLGAFLVLTPAWTKKVMPAHGPLAPSTGDVAAVRKVDTMRSMRLAENERKTDVPALVLPPAVAIHGGDFRTTWATAEKDDGMSRTLAMTLPGFFWPSNNTITPDLKTSEFHVD